MLKTKREKILLIGILLILTFVPLIYSRVTIDIFEFHRLIFSVFIFIANLVLLISKNLHKITSKDFKLWISFIFLLILTITISNFYNSKEVLILKQTFYWINILNISLIVYNILQYLYDDITNYIPKIIIIPSAIISILGLLQLIGYNLIGEITSTRPGSLMNTRNFVCDYLIVSFPFLLISFILSEKKKELILYTVLVFIIIFYLFSLRSRTAYLMILFHGSIMLTLGFSKKISGKKNYFIRVFIFSVLIIISFFLSKIEFPYSDQSRKSQSTIIESFSDIKYPANISRLYFYDASFKMFLSNPILGIGSGVWAGYFGKYHGDEFGDITTYNNSAIFAHNDFLEYLAETGVFGFLFYIGIFLYPLIRLFKKTKSEIKYLPFLLSIAGFMVISLIAFPKENINLMFIVILCIIVSFGNNESQNNSSHIYLIFIIIISLSSLIFNFLRVKSENNYISAINKKAEYKYSELIQTIEKINSYIYPYDPNKIPLDYYSGVGYYEIKNYERALTSFDNAIKIMPYFPQIISNKATTLFALGEKEKAENLLLELKINFPYYYEPQINLLVLYMKDKRFLEAENLIKEIENKEEGQKYKNAKNYNIFLKIKKDLNEIKNN